MSYAESRKYELSLTGLIERTKSIERELTRGCYGVAYEEAKILRSQLLDITTGCANVTSPRQP